MKKQIWVSPNKGAWRVHAPNSDRAIGVFDTKQAAVKCGTDVAKNQGAEILIQKMDGTIGERNSFGSDPFPPRG